MRPSWDEWALGLAWAVAERADCTRSKVGAALLDAEHRVRGTGYNGAPSGQPGCLTAGACPRGQLNSVQPGSSYETGPGTCHAVHAELNALLYSDVAARKGATLYVTREPCGGCSRIIAGAGVVRVVWPEGERCQ